MPNIKFIYFDLWGRGETTRMILGISGVKFEDHIEKNWEALKPNTPWGTLPILEVDGQQLGQSKAVHRYAANLTGLAGKTPFESAVADSIVDAVSDVMDGVVPVVFGPADQKETLKKTFLEKTLNPFLEKAEKILVNNNGGTGYFVGSDLTWADIHYFVSFKQVRDVCGEHILDGAPKLKALFERVQFHTKVRQYLANKPPKN